MGSTEGSSSRRRRKQGTTMKPGGFKLDHNSPTFSCSTSVSSLSSNDDEKLRFKKRKAPNPASVAPKSDGIKKTPVARIKKSTTLPSSLSSQKGIRELRKVKSEVSKNLDRGELLSSETAPPTHDDDQLAVIMNPEKIPNGNGIEMLEHDDDAASSKEMSMCQELTIISNEESQGEDEDEEGVNAVEEKKLIVSNPRTPSSTQNRLQNLSDLIMWKDASKSGLVFGIGAFTIISSSHTPDFNISFISVVSYFGLAYLGAVFISRSFLTRKSYDEKEEEEEEIVVFGEEEAEWVMKLALPYVNEVLLNFRALFSGDPFTTIKLAVLLFILAKYGGSITIWKMTKLVFVGIFTVPRACSAYSVRFSSYGTLWMEILGNAWKSCSHKKAIGFVILSIVWNSTSVVARIWTLFMLFVAFKCYQQSIVHKLEELQEDNIYEK